jgi:hypothetical protein
MLPGKEKSVTDDTTPNTAGRTAIVVDLAKSVFELAVSPRPGRVAERHRLGRGELLRFFAQRPRNKTDRADAKAARPSK